MAAVDSNRIGGDEMSDVISIRAHFDGKTIVPDEPVDLPPNTALIIDIRAGEDTASSASEKPSASIVERQLLGIQRIAKMMEGLPEIPLEALRRENLYADDNY